MQSILLMPLLDTLLYGTLAAYPDAVLPRAFGVTGWIPMGSIALRGHLAPAPPPYMSAPLCTVVEGSER